LWISCLILFFVIGHLIKLLIIFYLNLANKLKIFDIFLKICITLDFIVFFLLKCQ